jgi:DNA polymerase-1
LVLSDDEDLLHPRINTLGFQEAKDFGVITGRMSMDTPNLQNLSRTATGNTPANAVRKCIVSRPGHTLLMVDFDQIEARLIAHLTRDPGFIAAFAEGDFFLNITKALWGDESIVKADPRRQSSKNAIYARAYGAGAPKFARTAGIPEQAAYTMYARLDQLYPGWKAFTQELERVARERIDTEGSPYVKSFMTGRRHVAPEGKLYVLVNYLIQGTAAEIFKMKLVELAQAGMDAYMILPVHDEVLMDVPNELFADAVNSTLPIMNDSTLLTVPLTASGSKGQRWGEKTDLL